MRHQALDLIMKWCHWLVDSAPRMKWDVYERAQPLLDESLKFVGAKRGARYATEREEMQDWILNEVVSAFVPTTVEEKAIYANVTALTGHDLDDELKHLVSTNINKFLRREADERAKAVPGVDHREG